MRRNLTRQQQRAMWARRSKGRGLTQARGHFPGTELLTKHQGLVAGVAHSFARRFPGAQLDDLLQEGRMGLLRANQLYRKKPGAKFSTYAYHHISKRIREAARSSDLIHLPEKKANKGMATTSVRGQALDTAVRRRQSGGREFLHQLTTGGGIARAHASASLQRLFKRSRLPDLERRVLTLRYLNGQLTHREAAKRLKKSPSTIHSLERRAFAHLRKASMGGGA